MEIKELSHTISQMDSEQLEKLACRIILPLDSESIAHIIAQNYDVFDLTDYE